jgi:hypothetical protein
MQTAHIWLLHCGILTAEILAALAAGTTVNWWLVFGSLSDMGLSSPAISLPKGLNPWPGRSSTETTGQSEISDPASVSIRGRPEARPRRRSISARISA